LAGEGHSTGETKKEAQVTEAEKFLEAFDRMVAEASAIVRTKNADYGTSKEPFSNFLGSELLAGVPVERGMLVRMSDKFIRIRNLMDRPAATDESVRDTLIDLANYALILAIWLEGQRDKPQCRCL
jgi:hypothetical protein